MRARRDDQRWLHDFASQDPSLRDDALRDLQDMLLRGLSKSMSKQGQVNTAFLEDVVQDASLKILDKLPSYEGRSKFRTWAVTIAVRTALSQMRKKEWQNVSLDILTTDNELHPQQAVDESESTEQAANKLMLLEKLKSLIETELSERQWTAITAELRGMPLAQVAEKMGTNPNALYKVLHDARKKLRRGLEAAGVTMDDVLAALR